MTSTWLPRRLVAEGEGRARLRGDRGADQV